jgi:signal transduction histidine kinase
MTASVAPRPGTRRPGASVPWSPRAWRQALYLAGGIPALMIAPFLLLVDARVDHSKLKALFILACIFLATPLLTRVQRHRVRATAGAEIPPFPSSGVRYLTPAGIAAAARSQATWRQLCYHLLVAPAALAGALLTFGMWLCGVLFTFVYVYAWALPPAGLWRRGQSSPPQSALPSAHLPWLLGIPVDAWVTAGGIVLLLLAPRVTAAVARLDALAARPLLGPSRTEELEHRVEHLAQTRAGVVDAADAERRRLERDLHDGTQQRLVSLAMNLGMARAQAGTIEDARAAIADAHEEAKAALAELRNLVRGLHPAVLEDRGLDAALSGVTARMPIPVRLTVEVDRRPSAAIEAVAYFVVSEGLTNITKHAQASQAEVIVQRAGNRLQIIVTDDGVGGADPARGTGLEGLARRAESVDGTFEISSPEGGPTMITVDLPCTR